MIRTFRPFLLGVPLLAVGLGCGKDPYKAAPVSGKVTLDGRPLANAWVTFMPVGTKESPDPGPTSRGKTDAEGKYTLEFEPGRPGAVVGKHKVAINAGGGDTKGEDRDAGGPRQPKEKLPDVYNYKTTLTADVPAGGTETANFELKSRP